MAWMMIVMTLWYVRVFMMRPTKPKAMRAPPKDTSVLSIMEQGFLGPKRRGPLGQHANYLCGAR
jgi:hypothetical protein